MILTDGPIENMNDRRAQRRQGLGIARKVNHHWYSEDHQNTYQWYSSYVESSEPCVQANPR